MRRVAAAPPQPVAMWFLAWCGIAVGGIGAGAAGHVLLGVLRRGVRPRPGWCPAAVALLWTIVVARWATGGLSWWWLPVPLALAWLAVLLIACDLLASRLPDALTLSAYPLLGVALLCAAVGGSRPTLLAAAVVGAVLFGTVYLCVRLFAPAAMGPGDVKLSGGLGLAVGAVSPWAVFLVLVAAAFLTLVIGLLACRRRHGVPHGPAMLAPAWVVTVFGL